VVPNFPRSTLPIDWLLSLFLVGGLRFSLRVLSETQVNHNSTSGIRRVLIVGAGDAGALVVREMQKNNQLRLMPVCFLTAQTNRAANGVPVVGTLNDLARDRPAHPEVIIAIPQPLGGCTSGSGGVPCACFPFRTMQVSTN
jgi:FlaA1/EpsC-like NDP-sugar epimerase